MYNTIQMWNAGALFSKNGFSEKGRIYIQSSFAQLEIERGIEEGA